VSDIAPITFILVPSSEIVRMRMLTPRVKSGELVTTSFVLLWDKQVIELCHERLSVICKKQGSRACVISVMIV